MFPAPSVQFNPSCPKRSMGVLQTVTTCEEQKCQTGSVIKARTNHFSPAALTIGPGFPLPTTLFALAGKTSPGPSSYHLQGNTPSSCPEQLCAQNKTQPLLSRSTAWHCPKQPLSSHLPTWSSQLALKVSTPWHLHGTCNKPSVCRRLHNPLPIPPKFTAGLSPYLYR